MLASSMPSEVAGRHPGGWQHPCRHPLKAILRQNSQGYFSPKHHASDRRTGTDPSAWSQKPHSSYGYDYDDFWGRGWPSPFLYNLQQQGYPQQVQEEVQTAQHERVHERHYKPSQQTPTTADATVIDASKAESHDESGMVIVNLQKVYFDLQRVKGKMQQAGQDMQEVMNNMQQGLMKVQAPHDVQAKKKRGARTTHTLKPENLSTTVPNHTEGPLHMNHAHVPTVSQRHDHLEEKISALEKKVEELQMQISTKEGEQAIEANMTQRAETEKWTERPEEGRWSPIEEEGQQEEKLTEGSVDSDQTWHREVDIIF